MQPPRAVRILLVFGLLWGCGSSVSTRGFAPIDYPAAERTEAELILSRECFELGCGGDIIRCTSSLEPDCDLQEPPLSDDFDPFASCE